MLSYRYPLPEAVSAHLGDSGRDTPRVYPRPNVHMPPNKFLVLVAEDEGIIAFMLNAALADAGFDVAGPFGSCAAVDAWLKANSPDCALLDVLLSDGNCRSQAAELRKRGVPIIVVSGYPEHAVQLFEHDVWLGKPLSLENLVSTVHRLTAARQQPSARPIKDTVDRKGGGGREAGETG